jgi:hypothetical protein
MNVRRADRTSVAALAGYAVLSVLLFGVRVLPHPGRDFVGGLTTDPQVFIWSLAWWPHALIHGLNPFVTKEIWVPVGANLAWTQTAPGLAIALAPITLAAGPVVAYNVAALLMPALAAWTAFLLCRHVANATWPALVGGYLFGFSTYVVGGTLAHVQTTAVFVVPLVALVVLQFFEGGIGARELAFRLGLLLAVQGLLETEILFTTTLALVAALVLVAVFIPRGRERLVSAAAPLAGAYALAAVLLSPLLYYVLAGRSTEKAVLNDMFVGDALNFVVPTHVEAIGWWAGHLASRFPGNDVERGTYVGIPALVIVALFARMRARSQTGRFLLAAFLLGLLLTLGSWLTVDGRQLIELPWAHVGARPLFRGLMPVRFSLYTALVTAVIAAIWLAATAAPNWIRIGLPVLAVLALAPNVGLAAWAGPGTRTLFSPSPPTIPALFTGDGYRKCLRKHEVVLALPFGARGNSLIWQAKSGFWFRLAGGYIMNTIPPAFLHPEPVASVATNRIPAHIRVADVRAFARKASVSAIILNAAQSGAWRRKLDQLARPQAVGGVLIYRLTDRRRGDQPGSSSRAIPCGASVAGDLG